MVPAESSVHVLLTPPCLVPGPQEHHRPSAMWRSGQPRAAPPPPPPQWRGPCSTQPGEHGEGATGGDGGRGRGCGGRRERSDGRCARRSVAPSSPARPGQPYPVRLVESAPGTADTRHQTPCQIEPCQALPSAKTCTGTAKTSSIQRGCQVPRAALHPGLAGGHISLPATAHAGPAPGLVQEP